MSLHLALTLLSKLYYLKFYNSAKIELNTIWTLAP